jgi:hypothetical protein
VYIGCDSVKVPLVTDEEEKKSAASHVHFGQDETKRSTLLLGKSAFATVTVPTSGLGR